MLRTIQTVVAVTLTLLLLIALPSLLLWGVLAYTQEQTRVGLVDGLGLSEGITYTEAIAYFDCHYLFAGMTRAEFEGRLEVVGDYKAFPEDAFEDVETTVSVDFPTFNLSRNYTIGIDAVSQVSRQSFGAITEQVVCPK